MIAVQNLSKIALNTVLLTISSIVISPEVSALTIYNISGTFDDGGTIIGSFEYDAGDYTNVNITTTTGSDLAGAIYEDLDVFFGNSATGITILDSDTFSLLDLFFDPDFNNSFPGLSIISSYEQDDFGNIRNLISGNIAAVPFEFSPNLGLLLLLTTFGIQRGWENWRKEQRHKAE